MNKIVGKSQVGKSQVGNLAADERNESHGYIYISIPLNTLDLYALSSQHGDVAKTSIIYLGKTNQ